jgi:squalene-hopene/tetraprenyl-beta-curcumene cyclase
MGPGFDRSDTVRPTHRALQFLSSHQHADGSWSPLWFGNQDHPNEENPVYGTAKVLMAYRDLGLMDSAEAQRGVTWLVANQNEDGGWGTANPKSKLQNLKSSIEETSLAVEALLATHSSTLDSRPPTPAAQAFTRGLAWLIERVEKNQHRQPAPIGLYFAKLWYYERLYPLIFTAAALGRACRSFAHPDQPDLNDQTAPSRSP